MAARPFRWVAAAGAAPGAGSVWATDVTVNNTGSGDNHGVYGRNSGSDTYGYLGGETRGALGKHEVTGNYGYLGTPAAGVIGEMFLSSL